MLPLNTTIPVNIWDDYCDDGHVPEGEKQETYAYIESSEIPEAEQEKIMKVIYDYLVTHRTLLDLPRELEIKLSGIHIDFVNLTHFCRERLVPRLAELDYGSGLMYYGTPIHFYSES